MKFKRITCGVASLLLLSQSLFGQQEPLLRFPLKNNLKAPVSRSVAGKGGLKVLTATCGPDTIRYPYLKELVNSPGSTFNVDAMVGSVRTASEAYQTGNEVRIKGVSFWGSAYSVSPVSKTVDAKVYLYDVDSSNMPVSILDSAVVTISHNYDFYSVAFNAPVTVSKNFAVAVRCNVNDTIGIVVNDAGKSTGGIPGEGLAWRRFGSGVWNPALNFFGQDLEYMIFPIVEYDQPAVDFTAAQTGCTGTSVSVTNASSSLFANPMFNLIAFGQYWFGRQDTTFAWNFGDGSAVVKKQDTSHVYTAAGTYTITLTGTMLGYSTQCDVVKTKTITINSVPQITSQPAPASVCPGAGASFSVTASGQGLAYQWQEKTNNTFTDIAGAQSASYVLSAGHSITSATYRVLVSNSCSNGVPSEEAAFTAADAVKPEFTKVPHDTTIHLDVYSYIIPTATDNCGIPTVTRTAGFPPGSSFPEGTTTVTFEAADASGNKTTASFDVTYVPVTNVMLQRAGVLQGLYPNPATDYVTVDLTAFNSSPVVIEISDVSGKHAFRQECTAGALQRLDISGLEKGMYIIYVFRDGSSERGKLMVK